MAKVCEDLAELDADITSAGADKLLVIYFFSEWCGTCKTMSQVIEQVSSEVVEKDNDVSFIKVDVDVVEDAMRHREKRLNLAGFFD